MSNDLPKPEYLAKYKQLKELGVHKLRGKRVEVEVLPEIEMKSAGGLFIATTKDIQRSGTESNKVQLGVVLDVGDEVEGLNVGDVVELARFGVRFYSNHALIPTVTADKIALIHADEIARVIGDWSAARAVFS